jgi:hypothetical protein
MLKFAYFASKFLTIFKNYASNTDLILISFSSLLNESF